jgi:hypothetical protein
MGKTYRHRSRKHLLCLIAVMMEEKILSNGKEGEWRLFAATRGGAERYACWAGLVRRRVCATLPRSGEHLRQD